MFAQLLFSTLSIAASLQSGDVSVFDFTSTTILVSWGVVTDSAVTQYRLLATPIVNGQPWTPIAAGYPPIATPRRHTFTGLMPGTLHKVGL